MKFQNKNYFFFSHQLFKPGIDRSLICQGELIEVYKGSEMADNDIADSSETCSFEDCSENLDLIKLDEIAKQILSKIYEKWNPNNIPMVQKTMGFYTVAV